MVPAILHHALILPTVEVMRAPIQLRCMFSYTILANPEVEPHAPNTYQSILVPSDSFNSTCRKPFDGNYPHSFNDLFLRVWESFPPLFRLNSFVGTKLSQYPLLSQYLLMS